MLYYKSLVLLHILYVMQRFLKLPGATPITTDKVIQKPTLDDSQQLNIFPEQIKSIM